MEIFDVDEIHDVETPSTHLLKLKFPHNTAARLIPPLLQDAQHVVVMGPQEAPHHLL